MDRRRFLAASLAGTTGLLLSGVAVKQVADSHKFDLAALIEEVAAMPLAQLKNDGAWSVAQVFQHLAQSIDYAIDGYPQLKSEAFRSTAGSAAFNLFGAIGAMRHPLDQAIPGAPELDARLAVEEAFVLLQNSAARFLAYKGELAPHFAYGTLSHRQYENAHWLHIKNHLQIIS
jgi:hypothetical protein